MSLLLDPISSLLYMITGVSVPSDQLSYLVSLYISLAGAYFFKNKLQHSKISLDYQFYFIGLLGLSLYYLIWGKLVVLPILQVVISYILFQTIPIQKSAKYVFGFAMLFLSLCHINMVYVRLSAVDKDHSADFTGPIMIITQRISSLGFSLQDGLTKKDSELNEDQKKYAIRKMPTFAEYFAYMFNCFGIMCGPFAFYNDMIPWMKKEKLYPAKKKDAKLTTSSPLPVTMVLYKVSLPMIFFALYWIGTKSYSCRKSFDSDFIANTPLLERLFYLYVSLFLARCKYYGAWLFADGVHNVAGIGFNGYADDGSPRWDLISNINILNIESATGLKSYIDNWNLMTSKWIRYVSYDRLSVKYRTLPSFFLSAFWHGFFPGYYIMFFTSFVFLNVQRKVRRLIRPHFQTSTPARYFYEVVTFIITQLSIAYVAQSFVTLEWEGSIKFYRSLWFAGHILSVGLYLVLPNNKPKRSDQSKNGVAHSNGKIESEELKSNSHQNGHVRAR